MNTQSPVNPLLRVEQYPVATLKPYEKNSKIHDKKQVKQIAASIKEFGFNVPILIDGKNNIIAGHGRVLACKELGIDTVPAISIEHLTEAQKRAFIIADNKLTENAEWDKDMLALEFKELGSLDLSFDLDITGFSVSDIDLILGEETPEESEEENLADILQITEDTPVITKPGDIWQLGKHRLICGDSTDEATYEKLLDGSKAAMIICDPPYNVPVGGHVLQRDDGKHPEFAMASGEMSEAEFTYFLATVFGHLAAFSKNGSIHYVWMDWRHMQEMLTAGGRSYTELKNLCVWNKSVGGLGSFYRSKHELVFVFKNGTKPHTNNFELGQYGRPRSNVWDYPAPNCFFTDAESGETRDELVKLHPTVRPVAMVVDAIKDCSKQNEIILEPFIGSGTAIIAAEKAGRRCYGIDIEPQYVDVAIRRWQKITGEQTIHAETGKSFNEGE